MDVRILKYFLTIVREENITAAAEALHITQPTLSRQIMELEDELGKPLLIRGKRKVYLTEEGVLLRRYAEDIVALMEKAEHNLKFTEDSLSGELYIGGAESKAVRVVWRAAARIHRQYPDVKFVVSSRAITRTTEMLNAGLLDFGIVFRASSMGNRYEEIRLPETERWGVMMPVDCELASKKRITREDLLNIPLIAPSQVDNLADLAGWLGRKTEELNIIAEYRMIYHAQYMVEEGMGYILGIESRAFYKRNSNLVFRPLYPYLDETISLVWNRYRPMSKCGEKFIEILKEELAEEQERKKKR